MRPLEVASPERGSRRREGSWLPEPTLSQKSPARIFSSTPNHNFLLTLGTLGPFTKSLISFNLCQFGLRGCFSLVQAPPGFGVPYCRRQGTLPTDPQGPQNIPSPALEPADRRRLARSCSGWRQAGSLEAACAGSHIEVASSSGFQVSLSRCFG